MSQSAQSHLTLILDLSPKQWHLSSLEPDGQALSLLSFITQVLAFMNSHLALRHENTISVLGAFPRKSVMLYSTPGANDSGLDSTAPQDANTYQPFKTVDTIVSSRIMEEMESISDSIDSPTGLVGALSKGLCHINRVINPATRSSIESSSPLDPRMLILSVSPDMSTSYIPIMNTIFAAQKLKVKIDVCKIFGEDNVFLQQAAHLTGGSYVALMQRNALLQYLVMCFLASSSLRKIVAFPTHDRVDLRAACFCHKDIVDIGYVCSVCLSIFCSPVPVCSTCRTKFPVKTLRRFGFGPPKAVGNGTSKSGSATPQ
ncbi:hypothetical protein BS47DRAFT_749609 [Hydnum rufescens UP504]|uniref:General transcription and DNA repair factor IIH subunit TFB4 n=1 Tax=Hydnum rufescens UP504 TaxID=1448309 RepID=A0A9P6BCN4_9AGAM|nr:hypothetical protein BS47DRAFT_749609 [Hydnum rufescens UP504]